MPNLIATLVLVLFVASCAKPEYWIAGLTLPPGSTVVDEGDLKLNSSEGMPLDPAAKRAIFVSFNNAAGWDTVVSHIDACMARAGYSDVFEKERAGMGAVDTGMGNLGDFAKYMRMYAKEGSKLVVTLNSLESIGSGLGGIPGGEEMGGAETGTYTMIIEELKSLN